MQYEMAGAIKLIEDVQQFSSGFTKACFVITTKERFPQDVKFECVKERTALLDGLNPGDEVNVHFDIRGNEYNGNHYVNLNCWKLDANIDGTVNERPPADDMPPATEESDGPLPF